MNSISRSSQSVTDLRPWSDLALQCLCLHAFWPETIPETRLVPPHMKAIPGSIVLPIRISKCEINLHVRPAATYLAAD